MCGPRAAFIVFGAKVPQNVGLLIASFLSVRCNWCDENTGVLTFLGDSNYDWVCIPCVLGCIDDSMSS